jgi:polyhydroxyalkanoate synthesis repressor PhaR
MYVAARNKNTRDFTDRVETWSVIKGGHVNQIINQGQTIGLSSESSKHRAKIVKRYQNRKLYDTQQSCYVTLDDIAKMIRANEDVIVIDNKTKNDITAATLTQIIFEAEKKSAHYAPLATLRDVIQYENGSISAFLAKLGAFPKEQYLNQKPQQVMISTPSSTKDVKPTFDDMKQTLEKRVANAASSFQDVDYTENDFSEKLPELPNSNKSLGPA